MDELKLGDVVLLKFPFTDGRSYKRRPALILNGLDDDDIIICRITSKIYESSFDVMIERMGKSRTKTSVRYQSP